ncbi:MAG: UDP-N-acetylmuramoylalanine--D-glutamate ligase [Granulosicoccus sp.]|jgi:UDP-N-acetylmuramoylalanine--D-glutamate ligase
MSNKTWKTTTGKPEVESREQQFNDLLALRQEILERSISDVPSTKHRMEHVAEIDGVTYINDSHATNVDLTWYSLEGVTGQVVWIVGSMDTTNDYSMLKELVDEKVNTIICLGRENRKVFKAFMGSVDVIVAASTAEEAVRAAKTVAKESDTVLLSPACASHDLFESYKDRGDKFIKAVKDLEKKK